MGHLPHQPVIEQPGIQRSRLESHPVAPGTNTAAGGRRACCSCKERMGQTHLRLLTEAGDPSGVPAGDHAGGRRQCVQDAEYQEGHAGTAWETAVIALVQQEGVSGDRTDVGDT